MNPKPKGPLRSGYTTGACATAATVGALRALLSQAAPKEVSIRLPRGGEARFQLKSCDFGLRGASASVIKDAGDDPDVTHGAEIIAEVRLNRGGEIKFRRGPGVGEVTKPGLEIPPGEPAINPVPRRMMSEHAREVLLEFDRADEGVVITVCCPTGEALAKQTSNPRLGIVGGISILGTTGIVEPYSVSSYIASIHNGIDVAAATGETEIIVTVGGKSEAFAMKLFPAKSETCFVEMGNFFAATLKHVARTPAIRRLVFVGMPAKFVKIAQGRDDLSAKAGLPDRVFLWQLAHRCGAPAALKSRVLGANTTREVSQLALTEGWTGFHDAIRRACTEAAIRQLTASRRRRGSSKAPPECDFILIDENGSILAPERNP